MLGWAELVNSLVKSSRKPHKLNTYPHKHVLAFANGQNGGYQFWLESTIWGTEPFEGIWEPVINAELHCRRPIYMECIVYVMASRLYEYYTIVSDFPQNSGKLSTYASSWLGSLYSTHEEPGFKASAHYEPAKPDHTCMHACPTGAITALYTPIVWLFNPLFKEDWTCWANFNTMLYWVARQQFKRSPKTSMSLTHRLLVMIEITETDHRKNGKAAQKLRIGKQMITLQKVSSHLYVT